MKRILRFPLQRQSKKQRLMQEMVHDWEGKGFSHEVACCAVAICNEMDGIIKRLDKLEGK